MSATGDALGVVLAGDDAVELAEFLDNLVRMIDYDWNYAFGWLIETFYGSSYGVADFRAEIVSLCRTLAKAMR